MSIYWNKNNKVVDFQIEVEFQHPRRKNVKEKVDVYVPLKLFRIALANYISEYESYAKIEWNDGIIDLLMLKEAEELLEKITKKEEFVDICKAIYLDSDEYEDDLEEWSDEYDDYHEIDNETEI